MRRMIPLVVGCLLAVTARAEAPPRTAFKTVHLFNLASASAEAQLLSDLGDVNAAIAQAGHPDSRYRVWKVAGEKQGAHAYLWESTWADRATYDKVHAHSAFQAALKRATPSLQAALTDHVYNQYTELAVGSARK